MSVLDKVEVKIKAKIDVPKETADVCAKLLEIWVNVQNDRNINVDHVDLVDDGLFRRIQLVEGE